MNMARRPMILVSSSRNVSSYTRGFYAPVKSTPTIPSYNDQRGRNRPFQASSSHNIPDTRDFYVSTKSTVKTLTIPEHAGRNVSSTSRIPPPRAGGASSITVLSNVLLSEEDLREKARRMKREGQEARNLAKQARKRKDSSAEAMHKRNSRARECAMAAIFNQKNKGLSDGTVDLHGLYVNEALKYAKREFQSVVLRGDKVARFIVVVYDGSPMNLGKGLHAKNGMAKIRPALEKLCKK
ncbi:hypothetical protein V8E52_002119 [Russula decolorans]